MGLQPYNYQCTLALVGWLAGSQAGWLAGWLASGPPPSGGRARPAWAGLGQQGQAGSLAGWLLAGWLPLVCVVCCVL